MLNKALIIVFTATAIFVYAYMAECQAVKDGLVSFWTFDESDVEGEIVKAGNIEANSWQHVLGRYDGSDMEVFIDGISAGSVAHSGNIVSDTADVYIGSRPSDRRYNGLIDELRVHNRALSATEIHQKMNAQGLAVMTPTPRLTITWGKIKEEIKI